MDSRVFLKNFLGFLLLYSLVLVVINIVIWHKTWDEIDYMLNIFSATIISFIVGFSKARK